MFFFFLSFFTILFISMAFEEFKILTIKIYDRVKKINNDEASTQAPVSESVNAQASTQAPVSESVNAQASTQAPVSESVNAQASTKETVSESVNAQASTQAPVSERGNDPLSTSVSELGNDQASTSVSELGNDQASTLALVSERGNDPLSTSVSELDNDQASTLALVSELGNDQSSTLALVSERGNGQLSTSMSELTFVSEPMSELVWFDDNFPSLGNNTNNTKSSVKDENNVLKKLLDSSVIFMIEKKWSFTNVIAQLKKYMGNISHIEFSKQLSTLCNPDNGYLFSLDIKEYLENTLSKKHQKNFKILVVYEDQDLNKVSKILIGYREILSKDKYSNANFI
jgi:hypothetical protein